MPNVFVKKLLYFSKNTIIDFADEFVKRGGKYLFLDEIHKYRNWSQEIKNIYDYFPELKIVITVSSALDIFKGKADLSRRAILYKMNKPEKVYLNNANLFYALANNQVNMGSIRETFFYNQLKVGHHVAYSTKGDFLVDNIYTFEIGGKNKTQNQIAGMDNAFLAVDNIEYSHQNRIPLWLFGFLY